MTKEHAPDFYRMVVSRNRFQRMMKEICRDAIRHYKDGMGEDRSVGLAVDRVLEILDDNAKMQEKGLWDASQTNALYLKFIHPEQTTNETNDQP